MADNIIAKYLFSFQTKVFGNCTCVTPQSTNKLEYKQANFTNASAGKCDRRCKNFLLFAGLVMLTATISLAASTPHQIMLLRYEKCQSVFVTQSNIYDGAILRIIPGLSA